MHYYSEGSQVKAGNFHLFYTCTVQERMYLLYPRNSAQPDLIKGTVYVLSLHKMKLLYLQNTLCLSHNANNALLDRSMKEQMSLNI